MISYAVSICVRAHITVFIVPMCICEQINVRPLIRWIFSLVGYTNEACVSSDSIQSLIFNLIDFKP